MNRFKQPVFFIALIAIFYAALIFSACPNEENDTGDPPVTAVSMVGDAVKGWEDSDRNPLPVFMTRSGNTPVFVYEGTLFAGGFKISADANPRWEGRWFLPPGIDDVTLTDGAVGVVRYSTAGDGGELGAQWKITKDAKYRVTINIETRRITLDETGEADPGGTDDVFNAVWLIRCDESAPTAFPMEKSGDDWVITTSLLGRGVHVKFNGDDEPPLVWGTQDVPDNSRRWFYPSLNSASASGTVLFQYGADSPNAWRIPSAGDYTITLSPGDGTVTFEGGESGGEPSSRVWLVYTKEERHLTRGDSWEFDESGGIYNWQGALDGWYKFCASEDPPVDYAMGIWFGPQINDAPPAGTEENAFMDSLFAWEVPIGYYSISFNPSTEKATMVRMRDVQASDFNELWVIGLNPFPHEGSNFWDAPRNTARIMTDRGGGNYTWSYTFGQYEYFRVVCRNNGVVFSPHPAELRATGDGRSELQSLERTMVTRSELRAISAGVNQGLISWWPSQGSQTITVNLNTRRVSQRAWNSATDGPLVNPADGLDAGGPVASFGEPMHFLGNATPAGWDFNNRIQLSQNTGNVYTWQGSLTDGQVQFNQGGVVISPLTATTVPDTAGSHSFSVVRGSPNQIFTVTAGNYAIEVNMNTNMVTFTR